jgi:hypothetical protein
LHSDSIIPGWSRILVNKHHSNHLYLFGLRLRLDHSISINEALLLSLAQFETSGCDHPDTSVRLDNHLRPSSAIK